MVPGMASGSWGMAPTAGMPGRCAAGGRGGLEWDEVEPLVRQHLGALPIAVYVSTTYNAGVPAEEGGR